MILESKDFKNNEFMDKKFTCDGEDFSPHLKWSNPPDGTKSFALSVTRPDVDLVEISHWYIYNIPKEINEIEQDGKVPGLEVENDFCTINYEGPNATKGVHKYVFRVYAINVEKLEGITKKNFKRILRQHTIEYADLVGLFERKSIPKSYDSCNANGSCNPYGFRG